MNQPKPILTSEDVADSLRESQLEQAARDAHRAIDEVLRLKRENAGPCHDCRFHLHEGGAYTRPDLHRDYCRNPVVALPSYDPETSSTKQAMVSTFRVRRATGLCGPEGRLFQAIPKPPPPPPPVVRPQETSTWELICNFWRQVFS